MSKERWLGTGCYSILDINQPLPLLTIIIMFPGALLMVNTSIVYNKQAGQNTAITCFVAYWYTSR